MLQTKQMLGTEKGAAKRIYREKQRLLLDQNETKKDNVRQEKEKELDIELDKDYKTLDRFDVFWKSYPKKIGKQKCHRWFKNHKVTDNLVKQMLMTLDLQKKTQQWKKQNGQFIPHPYTWLNQGRWEDEIEQNRWDQIEGDL